MEDYTPSNGEPNLSNDRIAGSIIEMIGNTPLVHLSRINPYRNVNIYAKIEGQNPTGSIKDRIALKMIEQAEIQGDLKKGMTIIEATSGNTGIGIAMVCIIKRYECELVMSESVSIERQKVMHGFGAMVTLTDGKLGTDGAIQHTRQLLKEHPEKYFNLNQFDNKYNKVAHYKTTANEIWKQTRGEIDYFVSAIGTSGTIMGISEYLKEKKPSIKIVEAHPEKGHYIQGLKNMQEAIVPALYDPKKIDISINVESEDAFAVAREIVKKEAIFVGMSSGAALFAALEIAKRIDKGELTGSHVVVIFPDRGEKYLSTNLFDFQKD